MNDRSTTHATLLARLATGGDEAWSEFASRYGLLIRGFARRRGLSESDCDDVVQETLLALSKAMPSFKYDPAKGLFVPTSRLWSCMLCVANLFRKVPPAV